MTLFADPFFSKVLAMKNIFDLHLKIAVSKTQNTFIWPTRMILVSKMVSLPLPYEPTHGKTNNLHMRKQRRRSASR